LDGDLVALLASIISVQMGQFMILWYKIGRLESKIEMMVRNWCRCNGRS